MSVDIDLEEISGLPIDRDLLYSVFIINRYAKKFDEDAQDVFHENMGGTKAKMYSIKKRGLYSLKTDLVHRLVKGNLNEVTVEKHILDGGFECWCFSFEVGDEEFSFHQPTNLVSEDLLDLVGIEEPSEVDGEEIDYSGEAEVYKLDGSLDEALQIVSEYGIEPNNYLEKEEVEDYDSGATFPTVFHYKE